jgi:hypothetical protein
MELFIFMAKKKFSERIELLWRILVCIVSGTILSIWKILVFALAIVNFVVVLISDKRNRDIADFCDSWNSETYRFLRYITFVTNERPFPFTPLKRLGKFER